MLSATGAAFPGFLQGVDHVDLDALLCEASPHCLGLDGLLVQAKAGHASFQARDGLLLFCLRQLALGRSGEARGLLRGLDASERATQCKVVPLARGDDALRPEKLVQGPGMPERYRVGAVSVGGGVEEVEPVCVC